MSWDRLNVSDILGYKLTYTPVNWSCEGIPGGERIISEEDATSYHLDGLQEYINYSIALQTKGRKGYGHQSAPVYERTLPAGMLEEMKLLSVCGIDLLFTLSCCCCCRRCCCCCCCCCCYCCCCCCCRCRCCCCCCRCFCCAHST